MNKVKRANQVIDFLGGTSETARKLGIDDISKVSHWRKKGVSFRYVKKMADLAKIDPVELRPDIFG